MRELQAVSIGKPNFTCFFILEVQMEGRLQGWLIWWLGNLEDPGSFHRSAFYPSVSFILEMVPLMVMGWLPVTRWGYMLPHSL